MLPAPAPALIRVAAVGDIMWGSTYPWNDGRHLPPADPRPAGLFTPFIDILSTADIAFGNLEGVIVEPDHPGARPKCDGLVKGCFAFRMPPTLAPWLVVAGFDLLSLGNNHVRDFGLAGEDATRAVLDTLGIAYSGREDEVARIRVHGRAVSMFAAATQSTGWSVNRPEPLLAAIGAEKAAGALVIVSFHAGGEGPDYMRTPDARETFIGLNRGHVRAFARAAVAAGADLLLGHGPHVPRGMELVSGRLVAYSLGNFLTWQRFNLSGPNGLTQVLDVTLAADGSFVAGRIHPGRQPEPGGPVPDPEGAVLRLVDELSRLDFPVTGVRVAPDGALIPPESP
jgi:poly-gamma-glutamate capsule biosynthesis protein CapA/YwtB (metallophosphatase superfamily)